MQRRSLLLGLGGGAAGVAAAVLVALLLFHPAAETAGAAGIVPVLKVYNNGRLVYEKVGDPPTVNLLHLLANLLDDKSYPLYLPSGSAWTPSRTILSGYDSVVAIGDACNTYSIANEVRGATNVEVDAQSMTIRITSSVFWNKSDTIAVGLYMVELHNDIDSNGILLFCDEVPVDVSEGVVTIVYELKLPGGSG